MLTLASAIGVLFYFMLSAQMVDIKHDQAVQRESKEGRQAAMHYFLQDVFHCGASEARIGVMWSRFLWPVHWLCKSLLLFCVSFTSPDIIYLYDAG